MTTINLLSGSQAPIEPQPGDQFVIFGHPADTFQHSVDKHAGYRIDAQLDYLIEIAYQLDRAVEPALLDQPGDTLFCLVAEAARRPGNLNLSHQTP